MKIVTAGLSRLLRSLPNEREIEVRDSGGHLVMVGTPRECEHLAEAGHVEGAFNRRDTLVFVRLTVDTRVALARLRRKVSATGRTVCEASQLVRREHGSTFSHITRRTNTYAPRHRQEFKASISVKSSGELPACPHVRRIRP